MKKFKSYINQRKKGIIVGIIFCGIFWLYFKLFKIPIEAIIYPSWLCVCISFVYIILDYIKELKKYKALDRIQEYYDILTTELPVADNLEVEGYQRVLGVLSKDYEKYRIEMNGKYNNMKDYFSMWAHQIKTPIAAMRLNLQNEDSELSRRLLSELLKIEQYVEMVLNYFRLESEGTDYVIKEYDLDNIVKNVVKKYKNEFILRKISLNYVSLDTQVITDEKWFSFVVEQILSNALKYTFSGSITISMVTDKILCIEDEGIGIAAEDLPRIFENGFTGYNGRIDKKASGIGLYLCKRICNNLGHKIYAESVVDKGTKIFIDITQLDLEIG